MGPPRGGVLIDLNKVLWSRAGYGEVGKEISPWPQRWNEPLPALTFVTRKPFYSNRLDLFLEEFLPQGDI